MISSSAKKLIASGLTIAVVVAAVGLGAVKRPDKWMADALYQRGGSTSGEIIIIGIDDKALAELGPYNTWDRNIMASALDVLSSNPDKLPAVVSIDALYISETNEDADNHLAEAAGNLKNVVTATAADFSYDYSISGYEEPYDKLKDASYQGHINAMSDIDGIMRHAVLYIEPEQRVYSMAAKTAELYLNYIGEEITYPPVNSRGQFYVPLTGYPEDYYDGYSIADLINGRVPADYYAGKIVLIGPYAVGLQDAYITPIDSSRQMFGEEFQANVIQSIIDKNFKTELPDFPQLLLLVIVLLICSFFFSNKNIIRSVITYIAACIICLILAVVLYSTGFVTHPLWNIAGISVLLIISIVEHYLNASREKQAVTKTFERYVAPQIVNEILKEGTDNLSLGGKLCDIAVLFVDVRGFTTMSERLDPEKVVFILNRYLAVTSACIERNQGTLDKFVGDATMAFWGAPLPNTNSTYLAAKTALEIVRETEKLSLELKAEIGEELHVGVGVNFGPAIVGNMGSEKRMDYTAIGDTVNTAARLEANAPGGTVYISRSVADILGDRAETKSLGDSIKLKGKASGFEVLLLTDLKEEE